MSTKVTKILIAILVLVIVILVIVGFVTRDGKAPGDSRGGTFPTSGAEPGDGTGTTTTFGNRGSELGGGGPINVGGWQIGEFRQISPVAVAGATTVATTTATTTVRYVERNTGHIYDLVLDTGRRVRVSETTIPRTFNVLWGEGARRLVYQYFDDDNPNTVGNFSASITNNQLKGFFLGEDLVGAASSPDGKTIFKGGVTMDFAGGSKKNLISLSFGEWLIQWPNNSTVALNSKPSAGVVGYLYLLDTRGGFKKILGAPGLASSVSPDANNVLYSQSDASGFKTFIYKAGVSGSSAASTVSTLADKCGWGHRDTKVVYCAAPRTVPPGQYPDSWYQGLILFTDDIWVIDSVDLQSRLLSSTNLDAVSLFTDREDRYLFMTNKRDLTLWAMRLR